MICKEEGIIMPTKAETYLRKDVKHNRVFKEIEEDIRKILREYAFEKVLRVEHNTVGELIVEVQEDFSSELITELNDYIGFGCTLHKTSYAIQFVYKLPNEQWL